MTSERTINEGPARAGLRLSVTLLTVVPLRTGRADRETARWAMTLAPVAGLIPGAAAAVVLVAGGRLRFGSLVSAALAVAAMAAITRGLHLDGLADVADGLGGGRRPAEALAIMKRSDIGPFGVIALALTLLIQVAALAEVHFVAAIVAAVTGRLAVTWACREGVRAARTEGLGALVAGTVRTRDAVFATAAVVAASTLAGLAVWWLDDADWRLAVLLPLAVAAGLAVATGALRYVVRRLGGVTGDVLGALVELAVTTALLIAAIG
ncbi:MAG TPA: adenosylcobinamide-GDP ribazoletransferase [Streptosporangiaceae bacterium]|jgi:adenosylcobinamide-GDP ribazoletransferase